MLRLYANLKPRRNHLPPFIVNDFGAIPESNPRWLQPPETTYGVSVFIWEALWNVEKPQSIRFGGDQTHVAWTVLLDGKPVANWHDTENIERRKDGGSFGAAVDAPAGLHSLQFLVVQCLTQPIPKLLVKAFVNPKFGSNASAKMQSMLGQSIDIVSHSIKLPINMPITPNAS